MSNLNLFEGHYVVCNFCKEGKFHSTAENPNGLIPTLENSFEEQHSSHGGLEIIVAQKFLSEKLKEQYIDVDRPDLEPISTSIGNVTKKDILDSFKTHRRIRQQYLTQIQKEEHAGITCSNVISSVMQTFFAINIYPNIKYEISPLEFTNEEWLLPSIQ